MSLRKFLLAVLLCAPVLDASAQNADDGTGNPLLYALAWKQTAAEYQALYHQGFNIARLHVEAALAARQSGDKPLAVISDTSLPISTGVTVSLSATSRQLSSMPRNRRRVWPMKCQ